MKLLSSFAYIDPKGVEWEVPSGWVVDGASIPQVAWTFVGGPFEGKYRDASVIHDFGCDKKVKPWEKVHEVFYWAMLASGVETWRAKIMYAAVYHFGPRWPRQVVLTNQRTKERSAVERRALADAEPGSTAEILHIRRHHRSLGEIMSRQPEKADFDVRILPPQPRLNDAAFEKLKQAITASEPSASGGFSLEEIRAYHPDPAHH